MNASPRECDVLVVGAGPAGIAAGTCAAKSGARVVVVDEGTGPGGQIWRPSVRSAAPREAARWTTRVSGMARPSDAISASCRAFEASIANTSAPLTTRAPFSRQWSNIAVAWKIGCSSARRKLDMAMRLSTTRPVMDTVSPVAVSGVLNMVFKGKRRATDIPTATVLLKHRFKFGVSGSEQY